MTFDLKSAASLRELQEMLARVRPEHLDLPLEFIHIDRGCLFTLQHIGRQSIAEDKLEGDKGTFILPNLETPQRALILLASDAQAEIDRLNRVSTAIGAMRGPQS